MIFKQYYLGCLAQASYLIGDEESGVAAIVDPQRDVSQYMQDAKTYGLEIQHVLLTHLHADFLAGHLELKEKTGATIHLGVGAKVDFEAQLLEHNDLIEFGSVQIQALSTPGHTPESACYLVYEMDSDQESPYAVLTGDTLFIGDVGRPDLGAAAGFAPELLAGWLYDSLREKLMHLPDSTLVYPGHGAGSLCGKNLSSETVSTIGAQKEFNYALQPMPREDFIELMTAETPELPAYFLRTARLNREVHPIFSEETHVESKGLRAESFLAAVEDGAQILDTRDPDRFAKRHPRGAVNIGLNGQYASNAGAVLDPDRPIVIVAERGRERESIVRLARIGFDAVLGYLDDPLDAMPEAELRESARTSCSQLAGRLSGSQRPLLLDIRTKPERRKGSIGDDLHIPLGELERRVSEIPAAESIVVYCAAGYRSSIGASILRRAGHEQVTDLVGGFTAWTLRERAAVAES